MYLAREEIYGQDIILRQTYEYLLKEKGRIEKFFSGAEYKEIVYLACGSSYWMSLSAARTMQKALGRKCQAVKSGEVLLDPQYYRNAFQQPLFVLPTRSGMTTETLRAIRMLKEWYSSPVLLLLEYEEALLPECADMILRLPWANEQSVCQTRSFSSLYLACVMITAFLTNDEELLMELDEYLKKFPEYCKEGERLISQIIREMPDCQSIVSLGHGVQYGIAIEGAYIAIEMAQFPAHYYSTLEFRHGPIVMTEKNWLVFLWSDGKNKTLEEEIAREIREQGVRVVTIAGENTFCHADYRAGMGKACRDEVTALYGIFLMQAFAYEKACQLGRNPDQPKELIPYISIA